MPFELQVIHASDFIQTNPKGHFDLAGSKAVLAAIARACRKRCINQALVDLRAVPVGPKPVFSTADLIELVKTFRGAGFTRQQRLAILYHSDPHHRARLFAFLSTVHGWAVQAFRDFEEAILWLSQNPSTPSAAGSSGEKPVRISFRTGSKTVKPTKSKGRLSGKTRQRSRLTPGVVPVSHRVVLKHKAL